MRLRPGNTATPSQETAPQGIDLRSCHSSEPPRVPGSSPSLSEETALESAASSRACCSLRGFSGLRTAEADPLLWPPLQVGSEPEGRGRPCSCDTQGVLHRQNAGLGVALGTQEADLSPLPFSPPAILRGGSDPADTSLQEGEQSGVSNVIWGGGLSWQGRCHRAGKPGQPSREHL